MKGKNHSVKKGFENGYSVIAQPALFSPDEVQMAMLSRLEQRAPYAGTIPSAFPGFPTRLLEKSHRREKHQHISVTRTC